MICGNTAGTGSVLPRRLRPRLTGLSLRLSRPTLRRYGSKVLHGPGSHAVR